MRVDHVPCGEHIRTRDKVILHLYDLSASAWGIPRGRIASADDVAGPIAFLLSEDARHITGSVLSVNGGGVLASS